MEIKDPFKGRSPEEAIMYWRYNPVEAANDIFGTYDPDWYLAPLQRIVLKNRWTHTTEYDVLSRGTGKTFLNALTASLKCMLFPGHRVGLIAPSFRQSKMVFEEVRKLWLKSPLFQQSCEPHITPESCTMKFKAAPGRNPSHLEALPLGSDGAKIRGARFFTVVADEAAQIDNDILNTVVRGFLATSENPGARAKFMAEQRAKIARGEMSEADLIRPDDNTFIASSTAFYQYNHLWQRVQGVMDEVLTPLKQYQIANQCSQEQALKALPHIRLAGGPLNGGQIPYRVMSNGRKCLTAFTYLDPPEGFMNLATIEESRAEMTDYVFRMEYEAFFPPDSEGFFRRQLLDAARSHNLFSCHLIPEKGLEYVMGIDPARTHDNFAISIFAVDNVNRMIMLVRVLTWNKKNFPEMARNVRRLIKQYKIKYFEMDAGGGGTTIRDLLANRENCPPGEKLILERDFDEHRALVGERMLGPLVQFSDSQWCHDANFNLLSGIQHGLMKIASVPANVGNVLWTPELEDADEEMEGALLEMSSIIVTSAGSRMHWDTPTKNQRKDRYSAVLIGYNAALKVLKDGARGPQLAMGFWQ